MILFSRRKFGLHLFVISLAVCFIQPSQSNQIERVSISTSGEQGNGGSFDPQSTGDGRLIVFQSNATNLVATDSNNAADIFLHNRDNGITELLSVTPSGEQASGWSYRPKISRDGRFVAFETQANNLINLDGTARHKIVLLDRNTGVTELVSRSLNGLGEPNHYSTNPSLSGDGRYVAYSSRANNIIADDNNNISDIFVYDRITQTNERVSVSSTGVELETFSDFPKISTDGRFVVFVSYKTGPGGVQSSDLWLHDRNTGSTELIVTNSGSDFYFFDINDDGHYVTFQSSRDDLTADDTDATMDIFVYDHFTQGISLVSISSIGEKGISYSDQPTISGDGRYVTFTSYSNNLLDRERGISSQQIYVHDRQRGLTALVSASETGVTAHAAGNEKHITPDGRFIIFRSSSTSLVDEDTNREHDVFVKDNPLTDPDNLALEVKKPINNIPRQDSASTAKLVTGSLYREYYTITNNTPYRIYQIKVYEGNTLVCDFFALNPGENKTRCYANETVLEGDQRDFVTVEARVSGTNELLRNYTNAYLTGINNGSAQLSVTHYINNKNADTEGLAVTVNAQPASVFYKIENTGDVELYRVKTYHDPVTPVNSGWNQQCVVGPIAPGQVRYCRRDITLPNTGLNHAIGRAQGVNAFVSPTTVINAENPTYFSVP